VLAPGSEISLTATKEGARFLLIAGKQLNGPVARGGPFVMNTREERRSPFICLNVLPKLFVQTNLPK